MTYESASKAMEQAEQLDKRARKQYSYISAMRLGVFTIIVIGLLLAIVDHHIWGYVIAIIGILSFLYLMHKHNLVEIQQRYYAARKKVFQRYAWKYTDEWRKIEDTGLEFLSEQDTVAKDLDLYGKNSLYQFLCVANTYHGREKLAKALQQPRYSEEILQQRHTAIEELLQKEEFCINFETLSMMMREKHTEDGRETEEQFLDKCRKQNTYLPKFVCVLRIVFPILLLLSIIGNAAGIFPVYTSIIIVVCMLGISWLTSRIIHHTIGAITKFTKQLEPYLYMFDAITMSEFESEGLAEIHERFHQHNIKKGIKELNVLCEAARCQYNPILHMILNGFVLWDYQIAVLFESWKKNYGTTVAGCFEVVGEIEELLSLTSLSRVKQTSAPILDNRQEPQFSAEDMYHPLLPQRTVQTNSIQLQTDTVIITGSNMSGKTTFLRTIGMNLILAYAGAQVCAKRMIASQMKVLTSMRVVDDVSSGISTFYAEILRIKQMVDASREGTPTINLIDEIFKGTNSADRIVGARAVIKQLTEPNTITLVSTHDFELCEQNNIKNYHFEEYYEEDTLRFDYVLRDGKCTTTNALQLMKMAGL